MLMDHADAERDGIERALDALTLAVDQNFAAVGCVKAVRDPHGRRFARAVLADDGVNGARLDRDVDVVVGENAAEALRDASKLEHYWNIASITLISPAIIFRFASSAAAMASADNSALLCSSTT